MTTIKSFTDLPQSEILSKILPLESADMHYVLIDSEKNLYSPSLGKYIGILPHHPAWSLAALIGVIPEVSLNTFKDGNWNAMVQHDGKMIYGDKDNPVDACYELILKLHELKIL